MTVCMTAQLSQIKTQRVEKGTFDWQKKLQDRAVLNCGENWLPYPGYFADHKTAYIGIYMEDILSSPILPIDNYISVMKNSSIIIRKKNKGGS